MDELRRCYCFTSSYGHGCGQDLSVGLLVGSFSFGAIEGPRSMVDSPECCSGGWVTSVWQRYSVPGGDLDEMEIPRFCESAGACVKALEVSMTGEVILCRME